MMSCIRSRLCQEEKMKQKKTGFCQEWRKRGKMRRPRRLGTRKSCSVHTLHKRGDFHKETYYVGLKSDNALYCGTLVPADHCANVNESADDTLALKII